MKKQLSTKVKLSIPWINLLKEAAIVIENSCTNISVNRATFQKDSGSRVMQILNGFPKFSWLLILTFFLTLNLSSQNKVDQNPSLNNTVKKSDAKSNLKYVESANIIVSQVWVQHTGDNNWVEHKLLYPREIQLIPATNDFANLLVELDCELPLPTLEENKNCIMPLPVGDYDQVRVVIKGGNVVLTEDAKVSKGNVFNTLLGNLKFPSGAQSGVDVAINPSIVVVTKLSEELTLNLDLAKSFVFNGSPEKGKGVKEVVFRPVDIPAMNNSTHGRISLKVTGSPNSYICEDGMPISGAWISALDQSGNFLTTVLTDENGEGTLILLPGTYDILVEANNQDEVTLQDKNVYIANETELGNITMKRPVASLEFNKDIAKLLAVMANTAYAQGGDNWNLNIDKMNDPDYYNGKLPNPTTPDNCTTEGCKFANSLSTKWSDYDCWKFFKFIDDADTGTQSFIAYNKLNGDIVVSFRGTTPGTEDEKDTFPWVNSMLEDIPTNTNIIREPWELSDGTIIDNAVHRGIKNAYFSVREELKNELINVINLEVQEPKQSRIYFTGHSLGACLAQEAALDLADFLVDEGYNRNNVIMYSIAPARTITKNLLPYYDQIVPNSFAIAAKDDYVTHYLENRLKYTHINKMVVLSTNIYYKNLNNFPWIIRIPEWISEPDPGKFDGVKKGERFRAIGDTRVEYRQSSNSLPYESKTLGPGYSIGSYERKGHDQLQYLKRIERIVDGGIPTISIKAVDVYPLFLNGWRMNFEWSGGVQGPIDWVGLFKTDRGAQPTIDDLESGLLANGWEWVVKADGYPELPDPNSSTSTKSSSVSPYNWTVRNGLVDDGKDYWVGYVDGFGRIIKKVKWNRTTNKSNIISTKSLEIEEEEQSGNNITIYPTPAGDIIYVEAGEISTSTSYQIFNVYGLKIADGKLSNNEMSVSKLPAGVYILKFITEQGAISKRFIKK